MPRVEANGIETYYEDYGEGEPLVVLHGATADHQVWAEQLQPLTDEYRVILYDLRGHGKTGESDWGTYTVDLYADDLVAFIEALELEQPTILGHSWGGMIGYVTAMRYPESISGLATVSAMTPQTYSTGEWAYKSVFMPLVTPVMDNDRIVNGIEWVFEQIFGDSPGGEMDELERLRDEHDCEMPEIAADERGKILDATRSYFSTERPIQDIDVPVLMLYGENELPFLEAHAENLQRILDDCQTAEIPDAGHNAQADNPDFILNHLRDFMTA